MAPISPLSNDISGFNSSVQSDTEAAFESQTTSVALVQEPAPDLAQEEPSFWNRAMGFLKMAGGVAETVVGGTIAVGTAPTVVGSAGGGLLAAHGVDTTAAGATQLLTGKETPTYTSDGITSITGSRLAGEVIDSVIGVFGSIGAGIAKIGRGAVSLARELPDFVRGTVSVSKLPAGTLGITDGVGNITITTGLSKEMFEHTLAHEKVHQFLSPKDGVLAKLRGALGALGYSRSDFLRFTEEAIAEGVATGSVRRGVEHALNPGYGIDLSKVATEGAVVTGIVGNSVASGSRIADASDE